MSNEISKPLKTELEVRPTSLAAKIGKAFKSILTQAREVELGGPQIKAPELILNEIKK